jgi:hypothetical protein
VDREGELVIFSGITLILFNIKHVRTQVPTSFAKDNILLNYCLPSSLCNSNTKDSKVFGSTLMFF